MASFCAQCSVDVFGSDFGDMKGITKASWWKKGEAACVLCEDCGYIQVDPEGNCVVDCDKHHFIGKWPYEEEQPA